MAQFAAPINDDDQVLFAFRWPSDAFLTLKDFWNFCNRWEIVFPLLIGQYDAQAVNLYFDESGQSAGTMSQAVQADARTLISHRFGADAVPWLKEKQFTQIVDESDGEYFSIRGSGPGGFFAATVAIDLVEVLTDGSVASTTKLKIKSTSAVATAPIPFDEPYFQAYCINDSDPDCEQDPYQAALAKIHKRVAERIGEKSIVHFSAYVEDENGIPINNLDEVAILDYAVIVASACPDDPNSKAFESNWLDEPTWLDLCVVLHEQMKHTRDFGHIFLEGVEQIRGASMHKPQASLFELLLGS